MLSFKSLTNAGSIENYPYIANLNYKNVNNSKNNILSKIKANPARDSKTTKDRGINKFLS